MSSTLFRFLALPCIGVLVSGTLGCSRTEEVPVSIDFAARVNGQPFSCDPISGKTADGSTITGLSLFVHELVLIAADGERLPVVLDEDGHWQSAEVALLDFEDGSGRCKNGTAGVRTVVTGTVVATTEQPAGLEFVLGVPFSLNHQDPSNAPPPLTGTRMHWSWRGGYKFLRLDGVSAEGDGFRTHIGSTGCEGRITDIISCKRPNLAHVELPSFDAASDTVVLELDRLFAGLSQEVAAASRDCMAGVDEPGCLAVFEALGLGLESGRPVGTASFFVSEKSGKR